MGIAAIGLASVIAACGGSSSSSSSGKTMGTTHIARAIQQSILSQEGVRTSVTCPLSVPEKAAYRFTCFAALAVGDYPMYVVEQGSHGAVVYSDHTPLRVLDRTTIERAIAAAIKKQRHLKSTVVCPAPALQSAGLTFTCVATFKGGHTVFDVTETDALGHVSFVGR